MRATGEQFPQQDSRKLIWGIYLSLLLFALFISDGLPFVVATKCWNNVMEL